MEGAMADVPKEVIEDQGSLGLRLKWDNTPAVRQRMREGFNLVVHYDPKLKRICNTAVERSLSNVKANLEVLRPVCPLYRSLGKAPDIVPLEKEVSQLYSLYNVVTSSKVILDQAWAIRHLITVLKSTVRPAKWWFLPDA